MAQKKVTTQVSASRKLELSRLTKKAVQREIMGTDVDILRFMLYLSSRTKCNLSERIIDAHISRSIETSSELTVTINDYDRELLNSGLLYNKLDVEVDGLWFRLSGVDFDSASNELVLHFEDREIAVLRQYTKWKIARRAKVTRAEFIVNLLREVREFDIPYQIPELHTVQLIERFDGDKVGGESVVAKNKGTKPDINQHGGKDHNSRFELFVKDAPATKEQIIIGNVILGVAEQMMHTHRSNHWYKLKVTAIMVAIHESELRNLPGEVGERNMAKQIDMYYKRHNSPLEGYGETYVAAGKKEGVDPRMLVAISAGESTWGTAGNYDFNAWGWLSGGDGNGNFKNWTQGINETMHYLGGPLYITHSPPFITTAQIGAVWAPIGAANDPTGKNKAWIPSVNRELKILGGDTEDVTYHGDKWKAKDANSRGSKSGKLGVFQQDKSWGSEQDRANPETAAKLFFQSALKDDAEFPDSPYERLAFRAQFPNKFWPDKSYGEPFTKWRAQAQDWVKHAGDTEGAAQNNSSAIKGQKGKEYYFWRGDIKGSGKSKYHNPENSWTCILRLADHVNWRAFFVSGVFYFLSEDDMIRQQPLMTVTEFTEGIRNIEGNFYQKKKSATLTITADVGRWTVPPSSVVEIKELGVFNGRWIVTEYDRSLFDLTATITLSRPRPELPEPLQTQKSDAASFAAPSVQSQPVGTGTGLVPGTVMTPQGPLPTIVGTREELAKAILLQKDKGWFDLNGRGTAQLNKVKVGMKLTNPFTKKPVDLDMRVMKLILWLISQGYTIGTTAWVEDHDGTNDGGSGFGHVNGFCIDIAGVNGQRLDLTKTQKSVDAAYKLAKELNGVQGELSPAQIITAGVGNVDVPGLAMQTKPNAAYYGGVGSTTMNDHRNHIHVGYHGASPVSKPTIIKMVFSPGIGFSYVPAFKESYHKGRGPYTMLDLNWIVIHMTAGATGTGAAEAVASGFKAGSKDAEGDYISAHYVVDSDSIVRCVLDTNGANATGATVSGNSANNLSISIEHCGEGQPSSAEWGTTYYQQVLQISAELTGKLAHAYGIPAVHLTPAQIPGNKGFVGHGDFAGVPGSGSDHTDPGPNFPWTQYLALVNAEMIKLG